jgi:hypothetical protein
MVTLDTFRALHEHDHKLACYCATCERWEVLDLERLIAEGRGDYCSIGRRPRCTCCRGRGDWQVRPLTAPTFIGLAVKARKVANNSSLSSDLAGAFV